ncbi:MAG: SocA family protein [Nitrospirae bacterium]|nr:SocA family protein [Nitrospirota bacterium]
MIQFRFNEMKTTQAAARFIRLNGGSINYTKLLKLLYLTDRQALARWERPLTGDVYVSMRNGPVLSKTYDLIDYPENPEHVSPWYRFILKQDYDVCLKGDTGIGELSNREIRLIDEIHETYKSYNVWQMIDICHRDCPEWNNPGDSSYPLPVEDILMALDKTPEEIELIADEIAELNYIDELFLYCETN